MLPLVCVLLWAVQLTGQDITPSPTQQFESTTLEPRNFETSDWEKATKGIDYRHSTKEQKNVNEDIGDTLGGQKARLEEEVKNLGGTAGPFWNKLVKFIFVIFVVMMVGILIYSIIRGENIFKTKEKIPQTTTFDLAEVETNLTDSDLNQFIVQAEREGNYPLAIRLQYLAIIKALARKKIIHYKKNKTNHIYVTKVNTTSFGEEFRRATNAFERIWFGQNMFTQTDYQVMKPDFQKWITTAQNLNGEKPSLNLNTP